MTRETSPPICIRCAEACAALAALGLLGGCGQSQAPVRGPAEVAAQQSGPPAIALSDLRPGGPPAPPPDPRDAFYEGDPQAIAAGQRDFQWYNCAGCHFRGGGGIGPALMDRKWRYGGSLDQIYRSIADGRPNGMPTWRGKIPAGQIWQLAAYVQWLSTPEALQLNAQPKTPLDPSADTGPHLETRFAAR